MRICCRVSQSESKKNQVFVFGSSCLFPHSFLLLLLLQYSGSCFDKRKQVLIKRSLLVVQDFDFLPAFRKRESPLMMLLASKRQRKNFGRWLIFLKIPKNILISERKFLVECSLLANQAQAKPFLLEQLQEKAECHSFIFRHLNLWKCLWELVRVGQGMRF